MDRRSTVLAVALCTAAVGSHALSLGPSRGLAVIGQALNLSFDVTLDPGVDAGSACAGAELYYGETRIDPSRYRVSTQAGSQPSQAVVQVASQVVVNEPVVSVVLRAGCGQTLSRRYVLLSASPTEGPAPVATDLPVLPSSVPAVAEPAASAGGSPAAGRNRRQRPARAAAETDNAPAATGAPFAPRPPAAVPKASPGGDGASGGRSAAERTPVGGLPPGTVRGRPRLELQSPGDWLNEHDLPLQPSLWMATPGTASPEQRAAAAAMWRSLNGEGEGAPAGSPAPAPAADDDRLRKLEAQLKVLQDNVSRGRTREADLQAQLDAARDEGGQLRVFLWPALAVLLLAALALAVGVYRRKTGKRKAWWKPSRSSAPDGLGGNTTSMYEEPEFVDTQPSMLGESALPEAEEFYPTSYPSGFPERAGLDDHLPAAVPEAVPVGQPRPPVAPSPAPVPVVVREQPAAMLPDADAAEMPGADYLPEAEPVEAPAAAAPQMNTRESALAAAQEMRASPPEVLLDVQQNADFFASVGQYEEAIDTLQHHISEHPQTSPVAYLDLVRILHTLSLTEPYRKLRDDFNAVFNGEMPAFAGFLKPSRGLEAFPEALHRIQAAWREPRVLDVLEIFLFRRLASDEGTSAFSLEAYRELLMLYEVARANQAGGGMGDVAPHVVTAATAIEAAAPLAASAPESAPVVPQPPPADPPTAALAAVSIEPPSLADLVSSRPAAKPELDEPLDFVLDDIPARPAPAPAPLNDFPEAPLRSSGTSMEPDIDLSLEFEDPTAPMMEFDLQPSSPPPEQELTLPAPPVQGFGAAPPKDDNLIDFDLFDVDTPPGKGVKK